MPCSSLVILEVFMIGVLVGVIVTYAKQGRILAKFRKVLELTTGAPPKVINSKLHVGMKALIVGNDPEMISIFSHMLREKGIDMRKCSLDSAAVDQLSSEKFEALVLDFDHVAGCAAILQRLPRPNERVLVFAVAGENAQKQAALDLGVTFIVERPMVPSQIREMLRIAYGRMLRDRQSYFRLAVQLPVSIKRESGTLWQCTTLNLSQSGMAIRAPSSFNVGELVNIAFAIPNTDLFVSAEGRVIWDDKHGKTGISFECSSASVQTRFHEWLHDHFFMSLKGDLADATAIEQVACER